LRHTDFDVDAAVWREIPCSSAIAGRVIPRSSIRAMSSSRRESFVPWACRVPEAKESGVRALAAALASGGMGVALALHGRGYHVNIAGWAWWGVAALPGALCLPWALAPGVRRSGAGIHVPGHQERQPAKRAPDSIA
jgi:hypothetical protein